jgi:hypothetical protein
VDESMSYTKPTWRYNNLLCSQDDSRRVVMAADFVLKTVSGSEEHFMLFNVKKPDPENY